MDRCSSSCPAPLTSQWQDELREKFDEEFEIVDAAISVRQQLGRQPVGPVPMVIRSIDFAKRDEIRDDLLARASGTSSSSTRRTSARRTRAVMSGAVKTRRYALAESLPGAPSGCC